jgi:hypothetical protein
MRIELLFVGPLGNYNAYAYSCATFQKDWTIERGMTAARHPIKLHIRVHVEIGPVPVIERWGRHEVIVGWCVIETMGNKLTPWSAPASSQG